MSTNPRSTSANFLGLPPLAGLLGRNADRAPKPHARPAMQNGMRRSAGTYPQATPRPSSSVDMNRLLAAVKVAPDLALIEWDGDRTRQALPAIRDDGNGVATNDNDFECLDPKRRKIRDRYITARFPGVARSSVELANAQHVIKSARLLFEDEQPDLAIELLELAIEEAPHESPLWLARLEILFLLRDRDGFVESARAFRQAHPHHDSWSEVERLGRALAPGEALFGAVAGPRDHDHYGPWPHLPNWIQAPWDLTAEIVAADFHRALQRVTPRAA